MSTPEPLEVTAERYFVLRRALGYQLREQRETVLSFARKMDALKRRKITLQLLIDWARASGRSPRQAAARYERVRRFLTAAASTRRNTVVAPPGYLGKTYGRRRPHVYTTTEIADLLAATRRLTPVRGLRPWTYRTLFGLLYATGLRVGEALRLDRRDVDLSSKTLIVKHSKGRSREIPLHRSVVDAITSYRVRRDARHPFVGSDALFLTEFRGTRLQYQDVSKAFRKLRRGIRWEKAPLPTLHDMRHSYAIRKFLDWLRAGKDVDAQMPALSAYMGHVGPSSTYWYLSAVPELVRLLSGYTERFAAMHDRGCP